MTPLPISYRLCAAVVVAIVWLVVPVAWAGDQEAVIEDLEVFSNEENMLVVCRLENVFTEDLEEIILSGIPATFIFHVSFYRNRFLWPDREISSFELRHSLSYDNLKDEFTVSFSETGREPVVVKRFAEARRLMGNLVDLPVAVLNRLDRGSTYYARVKASLGSLDLPFSTYFSFFLSPFEFETEWTSAAFKYQ
jgi:hypothetical protein